MPLLQQPRPAPMLREPIMYTARMLLPINGREDFLLQEPKTEGYVSRIVLTPLLVLALLRREEELRLSDETQQKYSKGKTLQDFTEITSAVQEQVAKEFGLGGDERSLREAVDAMRSAEVRFPEHRKAIINASHYRRFNRAGQSKYPAGSEVPELPLRSPAAPSSVKSLLELAMEEPSKALVVVLGSYT